MKQHLEEALLILFAVVFLATGLWMLLAHDRKVDTAISSTVLKPNETEKIVVDPRHHHISIVTRKGVQNSYLPDRPSSFTVDKDGRVVVQTRTWGTEIVPFLGGAFNKDGMRFAMGVNGFYWHKLDLGGGLLFDNKLHDLQIFGAVGYNVYDACSLFLGVNHRLEPVAGISLRI